MINRFALHQGDCIETIRFFEDCCIDAVVTDPPYGIRFMGKAWDGEDIDARSASRRLANSHDPSATPNGAHKSIAAEAGKYDLTPTAMRSFQEFSEEWAREAFRVLKPGGYLLSFASPRTYHRMVCGIEDAGFEIRDCIQWVFGSGFPKSHNLHGDREGWGTALKPAHEPIVVARKPLVGTVVANVQKYGTGALNIDGCRVATDESLNGGAYAEGGRQSVSQSLRQGGGMNAVGASAGEYVQPAGRWPANLIHDGSDEVVALFPAKAGASAPVIGTEASMASVGAVTGERERVPGAFHGDAGSAARFFYCAKASRADRNEGLTSSSTPAVTTDATMRDCETADWSTRNGNHHPTVKPTDLMAYLVRLVTPPGGIVLDPFMGSGSTGKAAMREGMRFIGCELDPQYLAIAQARIEHELATMEAARLAAEAASAPVPQLDLFA